MKILYFAELKHLSMYGRPIVGDRYVAMKDGPVPSTIYNILKSENEFLEYKDKYFTVNYWKNVTPIAEPNLDEFSDSDIECLEFSINEYKGKSWTVLRELSHDSAWTYTWEKVGENKTIPLGKIVDQSGAGPEVKEYIQEGIRYNSYRF